MSILAVHRRLKRLRRWCLLLVLLLVATPGFSSLGSLALRANPEIVRADGHSSITLTAEVRDSSGDPVPDGTQVHFTATAGRIDTVAATVHGRAHTKFTSDAIPGVAQVSAFSGASSSTISIRMVEDPQALSPNGRVLSLHGKYVAYSESLGVMEAIGDARLSWKGQKITAQAIQADLVSNVIRARGSVVIEARESKGRRKPAATPPVSVNPSGDAATPSSPGNTTPADATVPAPSSPPPTTDPAEENDPAEPADPPAADRPAPETSSTEPANQPTNGQPPSPDATAAAAQSPPADGAETPPTACCDLDPNTRHLHVEQFAVDMMSDLATVLTPDAKRLIDLPSLMELKQAGAAPDPLDWSELSDSDVLWVASQVMAVPGQKVQLRKTAAYVGGQRILRLPYHEISLAEGVSPEGQQYLGVGNEGLTVDIPYYVTMAPGGSTSLRLRHGSRTGFGWYGTNPGWQLDLEHRYGLPGANEGALSLGRITTGDWGLHWNHNQRLGRGTQAYALVDYPAHQDLFANLNVSHQARVGSLGLHLSGHKLQDRTLGRTIDLTAQSAPRSLGASKVKLALESRYYDSRGGDFVAFDGKRYEVAPSYSQELGLRLTPPMLKVGRGGLSSWMSVKHVWASQDRSGLGLAGALAFSQSLGSTGGIGLNYSFNRFPGNTFYGTAGQHNLSGSLRLSPSRRLFLGAFGSVGLDSPTWSMTTSAAYSFGPLWRLQLQQTAYRFPTLQEQDFQIALSRSFGTREVTLYWSRLEHRLMIQLGGGGF